MSDTPATFDADTLPPLRQRVLRMGDVAFRAMPGFSPSQHAKYDMAGPYGCAAAWLAEYRDRTYRPPETPAQLLGTYRHALAFEKLLAPELVATHGMSKAKGRGDEVLKAWKDAEQDMEMLYQQTWYQRLIAHSDTATEVQCYGDVLGQQWRCRVDALCVPGGDDTSANDLFGVWDLKPAPRKGWEDVYSPAERRYLPWFARPEWWSQLAMNRNLAAAMGYCTEDITPVGIIAIRPRGEDSNGEVRSADVRIVSAMGWHVTARDEEGRVTWEYDMGAALDRMANDGQAMAVALVADPRPELPACGTCPYCVPRKTNATPQHLY